MSSQGQFNPLRVAKQRISSYASTWSNESDNVQHDLEKRLSIDSDYIDSPTSSTTYASRVSSQSHEPMLRRTSSSSPSRKARNQFQYSHNTRPLWRRCTPRCSSRMFSFTLFFAIVMFIFTLARLHRSSISDVESGKFKVAPPPPAWENFPFLKRYHGGIRTLVSRQNNKPEYPAREDDENLANKGETTSAKNQGDKATLEKRFPTSDPFSPYPKYESVGYMEKYGPVQECFLDAGKTIRLPPVRAFNGVPSGQPDPVMGSHSLLGLRDDICFDRFGRMGPYGYGYSKKMGGSGAGMEGDREGIENIWTEEVDYVDYAKVQWGDAVKRCEDTNRQRFKTQPKNRNSFYRLLEGGGLENETATHIVPRQVELSDSSPPDSELKNTTTTAPPSISKELLPRTAVLIRTWNDYEYDEEDIFYLRSLIAELALHSGGEYSVHFLIHVRDPGLQIWADNDIYQEVLNASLPEEFYGLGTLWSEKQMELIYSGLEESNYRNLPVYGVYRSTFQTVTYFAQQHPEYDYFWHLEMDQRYSGQWYHLFDRASNWASKQPRKGLWERNSRFYIPSEHGSWEDFSHMVRVQTEHGTASPSNMYAALKDNPSVPDSVKNEMAPPKQEKPIWGPEPPLDDELNTANDVIPPHSEKADKNTWGVGEEADLILFNPIFDPDGTSWLLAEDVTGYNRSRGFPPRRTAINTFGRYSRKLLMQMHIDTLYSRKSMFSEMWPASCALHHGFKAVYAPHPVFVDRSWPTPYLASIFNGGRNGAAGGSRMSVFSDERQHNFRGTTWYYDAGFAPNLWKRWWGLRIDNDGGEMEEMEGEGRMCLPGVLIHPVKQVDLLVESLVDDV